MGQQACCDANRPAEYDPTMLSTPKKSRKQRYRDRLTSSSKYSPLQTDP